LVARAEIGATDQALIVLNKGLKECSDIYQVALIRDRLAAIHRMKADFGKAERLYKENLLVFDDFNDQIRIAETLFALAWINKRRGNYPQAENIYRKSLKICREEFKHCQTVKR